MPRTSVDGWELAFDDEGSGNAVLLLHGLLMDRSMWDDQVRALRDRFRVIIVDAPGHGESPARPIGFTFEDEAAVLVTLASSLGVERAVWGGHSMGGMKAMQIALTHPERVRALILIDAQPYPEPQETLPQYEALLQVAKEQGISEDLGEVVAQILFHGSIPAEERRRWIKRWMDIGVAVEGEARAVFDRGDISGRMGEITAPTLVVHGAEDTPIPVEVARRYAPTIPGATLVEIPDCGHTSPCEKAGEVTRAILDFLARLG